MTLSRYKPRVVILGGGYAGLSAALELPSHVYDVTLIDQRPAFLDVARLQLTAHQPIEDLQIPFTEIAAKHGWRFIQGSAEPSPANLAAWHQAHQLSVNGEPLPFEFLIVATGSRGAVLPQSSAAINLEQLKHTGALPYLDTLRTQPKPWKLAVIGGGPTGIQFLFELVSALKNEAVEISFIDAERQLLSGFPAAFHQGIQERLKQRPQVNYFPATLCQQLDEHAIQLQQGNQVFEIKADLILQFIGVLPNPNLACDRFGQITLPASGAPRVLEGIFAAGDCGRFDGPGLNRLSAQAASRKGRLVATNVRHLARGQPLEVYQHREVGYFLSLGTGDGLGWMAQENRIVGGQLAWAIKEVTERQFALKLRWP